MPMRHFTKFVAFILLLVGCLSAMAQQPAATPPPAPSALPPPWQIKLGSVSVNGSLRLRMESWDWFQSATANNDYTFGAAWLRVGLGQQRPKFDWQVEGGFPLLINIPDDAIGPAPEGQLGLGASYFAASGRQSGTGFIKQAFLRLKGFAGDQASTLRFGRFDFAEGAETTPADATLALIKRDRIANRLLGPFTFTHIQRSFDGAHYVRNTKDWNLTVAGGRPTEGVFQLDGWGELDVDFLYGCFTKNLPATSAQSEARGFVLYYRDGRDTLKADNRPAPARSADHDNINITTFGGNFISAIKTGSGTIDLLFWVAGQAGSWGLQDHSAGAFAAEAGYQFPSRLQPWIRGGYFKSTGDGNPLDDKHKTFFQVLPTPRVYARTPFFNLMNNEDYFAEFMIKPTTKMSVRTDIHGLRLSNRADLWYTGGGAFQDQTFGFAGRPSFGQNSLGTLFDLSVDYNFARWTSATVYIAGVHGGDVPAAIYKSGGDHPPLHFFYLEFSQRF